MNRDFTGFVLAGGKSSRMGVDKITLKFDGETFLQRAAKTLSQTCKEVKIVLNQTQMLETDFEIVRDIYPHRGALGAIHAGLKNCETEFALCLAVDLPFVTSESVENLQTHALETSKFQAVVPRQNDGRFQPLFAIYRAKYCLSAIEKLLIESENASARDFLALISPKYIDQTSLSANENLLFNVNTPIDFQQIQSSQSGV